MAIAATVGVEGDTPRDLSMVTEVTLVGEVAIVVEEVVTVVALHELFPRSFGKITTPGYSSQIVNQTSYPGQVTAVADPDVKAKEDEIVSSKDLEKLRVATSKPWRPGYGTRGHAVTLWANYFQILPKSDSTLYRYTIQVHPVSSPKKKASQGTEEDPPKGRKLRRTIELFLKGSPFDEMQNEFATDFVSTLVTTKLIEEPLPSRRVPYIRDFEEEAKPQDPEFDIRVIEPQTLSISQLLDYIQSGSTALDGDDRARYIQVLNIILGYWPKTLDSISSQGANRHYTVSGQLAESFPLGAGAVAWRGFFVSARLATMKILYNVQVKNGAFYEEGPLKSMIDAHHAEPGRSQFKLNKFLKRVRVELTHLTSRSGSSSSARSRAKKHVKTIFGLAQMTDGQDGDKEPPRVSAFGAGPKAVQFWHSATERYVSVADWFKQQYDIAVDQDYPVVNVGTSKNPSYLPAEVCRVLPGQPIVTLLSANQTEQMIRFAIRPPGANASTIANKSQQMLQLGPNNPVLTSFGVKLSNRLLAVNGRILPSPSVMYSNDRTFITSAGQWNMRNIRFVEGREIRSWGCIRITFQSQAQDRMPFHTLQTAVASFTEALTTNGVRAPPSLKPIEQIFDAKQSNIFDQLTAVMGRIQRHNSKPQIILVVLPKAGRSSEIWLYNAIKILGDTQLGIHTVCVVDQKFAKENNAQYFANVALKFNMKLGGRNQALNGVDLDFLSEGETMLASLDVTHPSPGSSKYAPSIAAMVASIDRNCFQYRAQIKIQEKAKQEMVSSLPDMTTNLLKKWQLVNKSLPANIIIYRDGVSEGQYDLVLRNELPDIREACRKLYPAPDTKAGLPRITVAIVGKRHHVRFYATDENSQNTDGRSKNPANGTVVDRGVTEARGWEFYLQAHQAIQGTARSAHYYIIHDEIFKNIKIVAPMQNPADVFEKITHSLSYLFGRATKAVSICPPAYYADLVCDRTRRWNAKLFDGSADEGPQANVRPIAAVHRNVVDSMWWV